MNTPNHIRLRQVKGIGEKRFASILAKIEETGQSLDILFKMSPADIAKTFKLPKNVAQAVASSPEPQNLDTPKVNLLTNGIVTLTRDDETYPVCLKPVLKEKAPATLYAWGNLDLLCKPSVGFCGSRDASEKGLDVTADAAQQIAELGWVVISGHARGVDTTAHRVALEHGGSTIIVAAEGIDQFKLRTDLKKIAKPEQLLILSQFSRAARWTVGNAMARNATIIGLSDAMILVEARTEGGTFEAGKLALKLKMPLYVAQYETPGESATGNTYFLKQGAVALRKNRDTLKANIDPLREQVNAKHQTESASHAAEPQQLSLLDGIPQLVDA